MGVAIQTEHLTKIYDGRVIAVNDMSFSVPTGALIVATNWAHTPTAPLIAILLFPYLVFPWFLVVLLLGLNPVTGSRLEALSDGILSRPVTRTEYLL